MTGADDPDCRGAFPWDQPDQWDNDLLNHYRKATAMRHQHPVLSLGTYKRLYAQGEVYGFTRNHGDEEALVFFNAGSNPETVQIDASKLSADSYQSVWGATESYGISDGKLTVTVPTRDAAVLWHPAH